MSEDNKNIDMKSCSESNVFNDSMSVNNVKQTESDKPKLRRTFTLPRNPFGSVRVSNRRPKTSENQQSPPSDESIETSETENEKPGIKIFRRPSWRRFINKIAQRMNAVGVPGVKLPQPDSRVPPVGGFPWPPDQTPGVTGLRNHGNTCFMNAVLQCLSHTDILAEYFVLDQYKVDLSRRNKLNSRKFGTRGELTEQLALVLKALWACRDSPELSTGFKAVVERHGSQFRGSAQHDAQEFLNWLLERVHEDLNTATKRRYKSIKNTLGRPDEVVAAETLANYVRCHSSFVQAVFQAQFRSSLTCPRCLKQSNTFDPFHCIAVQLPQVSVQNVIITVLYSSQQPRQMRLGLTVSPETNIGTLRELLQSDTGIPAHRIVLTEIGEQGFTRTFCDSQPMSVLCEGDPVFCIEAPPLECSGDESSAEKRQAEDGELKNVPTIDGGPYLLLCWVNVLVKENAEIEKFGSPYAMQVPRDTGYGDLQKLILKDMAPMLHDNVLEGAQPLGVFRARLAEPLADPDGSQYVDTDVEHPLFTETFDTCLTLYPPDAGPPHIKLILEWGPKEYEELIQHSKDVIEDHSSVSQLQSKPLHCAPLTLEQCLEHYTKAETLADDNAWRCPHCQQYLPAVKTLGLWSLPDILVIHFVRFRQQQLKGPKSTKLTTMVDFPLQGFDMTPHLSRPYPPSDDVSLKAPVAPLLGGVGWSPWKRPRKSNQCNDNLYDLYAVCYHQGDDLETGHYTAACKNPFDSLWYKFDDTKVTMIDNDVQGALVNNGAYILFYQKQQGGSGGSSAASSTSGDHWAARMAPFPKPSSEITVTTKPNTVAPTTTVTKSESFAEEREPYSETNIRNSMSLSDNLMVDIGIDTDSKENINNERENNKNVKINEVITDLMKSKIDVNEYRRNTFDGTMNKDIHINPKMRSTTNLNRSSLTSIKSDSKINLITNVKVADLLLKSKTVADKNTSHVECPEKIVENCVSVSRVRKVDVQSGHVSQSGTNVTRALGRYATLGPEQTLRNTMDYRDHHSDDEALPARNDWMSPLSMRRAVVPP